MRLWVSRVQFTTTTAAAAGCSIVLHAGILAALSSFGTPSREAPRGVDAPGAPTRLLTLVPENPLHATGAEASPEAPSSVLNEIPSPSTESPSAENAAEKKLLPTAPVPHAGSVVAQAKPLVRVARETRETRSDPPVTDVNSQARVEETPYSGDVSFAGVAAPRAGRVTYVLDVSGAMTGVLPNVIAELLRSVRRLEPWQRFQVITFRTALGEVPAADVFRADARTSWCEATPENTSRLHAWLDAVRPGGASDLLPGLRRALAEEPEVIFVLTRSIPRTGSSWGQGVAATLTELDALNPRVANTGRRSALIKTIQFLHDDPTGLLPAIAREHGGGEGSYRVIRLDDEPAR